MQNSQQRTLVGGPSSGPSRAETPVTPVTGFLTKPHNYPNPGYLGSFSHTTLFNHLPVGDEGINETTPDVGQAWGSLSEKIVNEAHVSQGVELIEQLHRFVQIPACVRLVRGWLATGANLPISGLFTENCIITAEYILEGLCGSSINAMEIARNLFIQSCRPLAMDATTSFDDFCAQFCQQNARWETLGLFFTTVSRATFRFSSPETPYNSEQQRRNLRKLAMHYSDRCLEFSLSLDCLNDLQLILQYENFILHSLVDGDQSRFSHRSRPANSNCHLRLSIMEKARRRRQLLVRSWVSPRYQKQCSGPRFPQRPQASYICPGLFCRQEYLYFSRSPIANPPTTLPFSSAGAGFGNLNK